MSKNTIRYALIFAVFLIFTASAFALNEDFDAAAHKKIVSACSGAISTDSLIVQNTGGVTSAYSITTAGTISDYTTFSETNFNLEPGETKAVDYFIRAPSVEGSFDLKTKINTVFGLSKTIEQDVEVKKCVDLQLYVKDNKKESCPCDTVTYEIELSNNGPLVESYNLQFSQYSEYASFSENPVILGPGESRAVFIFLNLPCRIYGEKTIELSANAEKSGYTGFVSLYLNIDQGCYDYFISTNNVSMCNFENRDSIITINNAADVSNTYDLKLDGPRFAWLENDAYLVHQKNSGTLPLKINTQNVPAENYNFTIESVSERGELEKTANFAIAVEKCYGLWLGIEATSDDLVDCEKKSYEIDINNTGTKAGEYLLKLDGASMFSLSKNWIAIPPKSMGIATLNVDVPCNETGKRYAKLTVSLQNKTISNAVELGYELHSVADSYMLEFETPQKTIDYKTKSVPIIIKNIGLRKGSYTINTDGPGWIESSENKISLGPGEGKEILLLTSPSENTSEDRYKIDLIARLDGSDIAYKTSFNLKLIKIPLATKIYNNAKDFLSLYWLFILLGIVVLIALILIITALRKAFRIAEERRAREPVVTEEPLRLKSRVTEGKAWKAVLMLLLVLILLGLSIIAYSYLPGVSSIFGKGNATDEKITMEPKAKMLIDTGRLSSIGSLIIIDNNETIWVSVRNNENKSASYSIKSNVQWIKLSTKKITLDPFEEKLFFMTIAPPESGVHKVVVTIENDDKSYKEELGLTIVNKDYFMKYWGFLAGGLVLLIILLLAFRGRNPKLKVKEDRIEFRKTKKERKTLKRIGVAVLIILLAANIGYLVYDNLKPSPNIEFGDAANETFKVDINKNEKLVLPLVFGNKFDDDVVYRINVDEDWIDTGAKKIRLNTNESVVANIVLAPGEDVKSGVYTIDISAEVENQDIKYTKAIELYVKEKSMLESFLYWLLVMLVIILAAIVVSKLRRGHENKESIAEEIRNEVKAKRKPAKKRKPISLK
jgi:uncharacterized membrane protein